MNEQAESIHQNDQEVEQKIREDLAHLHNYPSIGKLFSDPGSHDLQNIRTKLNATRERLDTVVRRGTDEEAKKAAKASEAIRLTLDFLQNLENDHRRS